jgi:hypothetical protein
MTVPTEVVSASSTGSTADFDHFRDIADLEAEGRATTRPT